MSLKDIAEIAATILASLGGGGVIVFALSSWLGRVWADRLMERERHEHASQLEQLKDSLKLASERQLTSLEAQLDIAKQKLLAEHTDRMAIYRADVDVMAGVVAKIEMIATKKRGPLTLEELTEFETQRLRVYAYLAMHAPQEVMDANDAFTDLVLELVFNDRDLEWPRIRDAAICTLNAIRTDVGIRTTPISYRGSR